jgi:hypothetical protein
VIELENYGIGLSAVHARLMTQVIEYLRSEGLLTFQLGGIRLPSVLVPAIAEVGSEAGSAPPLQAVAVSIEGLDGEMMLAPTAAAEHAGLPHSQAYGRDGVTRARRRTRRARRLDAAHPHAHRRLRNAKLPRDPGERPALLAQSPGLPSRLVLPPHEHMFASKQDGIGI